MGTVTSESELYDILTKYVIPVGQLEDYEFPVEDPNQFGRRKVPRKLQASGLGLRATFNNHYKCYRCNLNYRVDSRGLQTPETGKCYHHSGRYVNFPIQGWTCCTRREGCISNPYHVHQGERELQNYLGYVKTQDKLEREPNRHGIYALDCEMCYTVYGLELTRVTVINHKFETVYEQLVKPTNKILDYNTRFSGIKESDLDRVTTTLEDVHDHLRTLFSSKTIIVGHGLSHDMEALKLFHTRFIDTVQLYPHRRGLPYRNSLKSLANEYLGETIQKGFGHNSDEDAKAALKLVIAKAKRDTPERFR